MKTKSKLDVPPELAKTILHDMAAKTAFEAMPPSHRAEYAKWVGEAKKPQTREKRAAKALDMMRAWGAERTKKDSRKSSAK
ncbi:MAG TPA: YdeI/OmpD-associated family protein [Phycisphaerae bacterium]